MSFILGHHHVNVCLCPHLGLAKIFKLVSHLCNNVNLSFYFYLYFHPLLHQLSVSLSIFQRFFPCLCLYFFSLGPLSLFLSAIWIPLKFDLHSTFSKSFRVCLSFSISISVNLCLYVFLLPLFVSVFLSNFSYLCPSLYSIQSFVPTFHPVSLERAIRQSHGVRWPTTYLPGFFIKLLWYPAIDRP